MIQIENLTVQFGSVKPLNGLSVQFTEPVCGLIGPNGAGKTTLLNALSGFVTPISGSVKIDDTELLDMSPVQRVKHGLRRSFQTEQVVEDLSVYDNVLALLDHLDIPGHTCHQQVEDALTFTRLTGDRATLGADLNLFQRRMVEIARALVGNPKLILLDEPGAGMTEIEGRILLNVILEIPKRFDTQVILIDHDVDLISATCSQTLVLDFGQPIACGETRAVLADDEVRKAYLGADLI